MELARAFGLVADCGTPKCVEVQPFHERQTRRLCAVHCVNNLLQTHRYGPLDFHNLAVDLRQQQAAVQKASFAAPQMLRSLSDHVAMAFQDYDVQVVELALRREGVELQWFDSRRPLEDLDLFDRNCVGLVINRVALTERDGRIAERHWQCIRRWHGDKFVNLDSNLKQPVVWEDSTDVLVWLREKMLKDERSCVFRAVLAEQKDGIPEPEDWATMKGQAAAGPKGTGALARATACCTKAARAAAAGAAAAALAPRSRKQQAAAAADEEFQQALILSLKEAQLEAGSIVTMAAVQGDHPEAEIPEITEIPPPEEGGHRAGKRLARL